MPNCEICKSKIKDRVYKLKDGGYRLYRACSKVILHTFSEESLKDIDVEYYEKALVEKEIA